MFLYKRTSSQRTFIKTYLLTKHSKIPILLVHYQYSSTFYSSVIIIMYASFIQWIIPPRILKALFLFIRINHTFNSYSLLQIPLHFISIHQSSPYIVPHPCSFITSQLDPLKQYIVVYKYNHIFTPNFYVFEILYLQMYQSLLYAIVHLLLCIKPQLSILTILFKYAYLYDTEQLTSFISLLQHLIGNNTYSNSIYMPFYFSLSSSTSKIKQFRNLLKELIPYMSFMMSTM